MLKAVTRQATAVDAKIRAINADPATKHAISTAYFFDHFAAPSDIAVMVTEEDFMAAHEELIPSVSAGELAHYEKVRASFEGVKEKQPTIEDGMRSITKGSRKGKASVVGKGKGKAAATSDNEYDSAEMDGQVNGSLKGKGKAPMGFQDGTASDDEGLY